MEIRVVLLDLDGVVRHFDPSHVAEVERRHSLSPGALMTAAFEPDLLETVITGRITRATWVDQVGHAVSNCDAAAEWMSERGHPDEEILFEVDRLRSGGVTVAVLTNGTDTIPDEMVELGLDAHFDEIFNSAEIGFAKPDRRVFDHVCGALEVQPESVFFTDDSPAKLAGAIEIGMLARQFENVALFRAHLAEFGL